MDRLIYHNGNLVDAADARVGVTIAGALYGWGVFTTVGIYDGAAFAFDRHWERLVRHAERVRIQVPVDLDEARLAVNRLIELNRTRRGRARITVLKGDAGAWRIEHGREAEMLIFTSAEGTRPQDELAITISPYRLLSSSPLAGIKQTAMLENLMALEEARSRSFTEAVVLNERGEIVSATAANIFWVEGDELYTPALATGCVAGITRGFICEIAKRMRVHLIEGGFPVQRLSDAKEVFLTSTARQIAPVASFDIKQYNPKQARVTRLVGREFQKLIRSAKISSGVK